MWKPYTKYDSLTGRYSVFAGSEFDITDAWVDYVVPWWQFLRKAHLRRPRNPEELSEAVLICQLWCQERNKDIARAREILEEFKKKKSPD